MSIKENHFSVLRKCHQDIDELYSSHTDLTSTWVGQSAMNWFAITTKDAQESSTFSEISFNRTTLREYILSEKNSQKASAHLYDIVVNILAWGGMSYRHGRKALQCWDNWQPICDGLVSGKLNYTEAYDAFFEAQHSGKMSGIGPAYYTKLIFFLGNGEGLIMDQWTSKSINLIHEENVIKLTSGYVSKFADSAIYKKYVQSVAELAERMDISGTEFDKNNKMEELIFSISAKKKPKFLTKHEHEIVSAWRSYVEREWRRVY